MFGHKKQNFAPSGSVEYIIAGLGNPDRKYEETRHNAGFIVVETLASKLGVNIDRLKFKSLCTDCRLGGHRVLLMKPQTYMNNSGTAIVEAMNFYKIPPQNVIIIFDDVSLPVGKIRIRQKGSDGGQNGMKNIIYLTGSDQFPRVKIGIGGKPNPEWDLAAWVLSQFTADEYKEIMTAAEKAADAVEMIVNDETDKAMNMYNS
ncbi:MAG: aminoacyl-tRNA hydrolase [Bacillota bacterium]|nr:aminoacyl-tRNA hydrolase [Bacillota bacterium]